jgi:excisionase family DNA binding protein
VAATAAPTTETDWISIGRACQLLGVNAATLRQWTADGRLRSYRTPGGHRRFSLSELTALSQRQEAPPAELTQTLIAQLRGRYRTMARSPQSQGAWWEALPPAMRERFHDLGEEVLARLGDALVARTARDRQRAAVVAREIGVRYGQLAREAGVDTAQAVEAYLRFRRPLLDVLARTIAAHPTLGEQLGRLMRDAEHFMDQVLAGLTGAHSAREAARPPGTLARGATPRGRGVGASS